MERPTPVLIAALLLASGLAARAQDARLADDYGFLPIEIYKLDDRIANLRSRDLDGDKVDDLVIANNARSRIDLLLSAPGASSRPDEPPDEPNEIHSDRRLRLRSLTVNREVVSLQTGDFNHDGKPDLAYYGTPSELQVLLNQGEGRFSEPRSFNVGEAIESPSALAVGDLDGNGRDDLALLTASEIVVVLQRESGLGDPERWPHAARSPGLLQLADLDGDGRPDLILLDDNPEAPLRVRLSAGGSALGPEEQFAIEPPRAVAFAELDGSPGLELLAIEERSGRTMVLDWTVQDEAAARAAEGRSGRALFFPIGPGESRGRSLGLGDLDGDGKTDVVATDPSRAQVLAFLQGPDGLAPGRSFPGLSGGRAVTVADLDGDRKAEVLVLSQAEKQIGRSVFEQDRLSFPTPLPTTGEPVALTAGDLDGDSAPEILYAVNTPPASGSGSGFALRALRRGPDGAFKAFRWGNEEAVPVQGLNSAPPALRILDVDGVAPADILVFNDYGTPVLLLGRKDQPPAPSTVGPGPLVNATAATLAPAPPGAPGVIAAQNTYARDVRLDPAGRWDVRDQYNSGQPSAQIQAAVALDMDGDGSLEVALMDRTSRSVLWLERKDKVYRPAGRLEIGPLEFQGLHVADFNGDKRDDLLVAGSDRFAVVLTGRGGPRLRTLASYTPERRDAHFSDLTAADLNGDGRPDILLTDTGKHFVELLAVPPGPPLALKPALAFPVFEAKTFRARDHFVEPREAATGDFDGDGRADFALVVHDRVLLYRQDSGPTETAATVPPAAGGEGK